MAIHSRSDKTVVLIDAAPGREGAVVYKRSGIVKTDDNRPPSDRAVEPISCDHLRISRIIRDCSATFPREEAPPPKHVMLSYNVLTIKEQSCNAPLRDT